MLFAHALTIAQYSEPHPVSTNGHLFKGKYLISAVQVNTSPSNTTPSTCIELECIHVVEDKLELFLTSYENPVKVCVDMFSDEYMHGQGVGNYMLRRMLLVSIRSQSVAVISHKQAASHRSPIVLKRFTNSIGIGEKD